MIVATVATAATTAVSGISVSVLGALLPTAAVAGRRDAVDRAFARLLAAPGGPPGAVVVIQRHGAPDVRTYGVSDLDTGAAFVGDDRVRIASVSKAFSGAAALRLVGEGALSLDDTIGERLQGFPETWRAITLRQLLQHTSGLPDILAAQAAQEAVGASPTVPLPPREIVAFAESEPLRFAPGSSYAYSNTDNFVVALMVEAVSGLGYDAFLAARVFGPLGLASTTLPVGVELSPPFAHGYDLSEGTPDDVTSAIAAGWAWASGGIVATGPDLGRFVRGYLGRALFDEAVQAEQLTFHPGGESEPPGPGRNAAGLGVFRYRTRCGTVYGHTGNTLGYTSFIAASRGGQRSVAVSVTTQLRPGRKGPFPLLREAETAAVCAALRA
jgi:D-alanyl-D-alanine carboxypeptidase